MRWLWQLLLRWGVGVTVPLGTGYEMRTAVLTRPKHGTPDDQGTFGDYVSDSGLHLKMGELPNRSNASYISCAPLGTFRVCWRWSPKHKRNCYHLINVPMRSVLEFHAGNLCGDVALGYATDSEGCLLPGLSVGTFKAGSVVGGHTLTKDQIGVVSSKDALAKMEADMREDNRQVDFDITITETI